ncbi:putative lysozyme-like protein [Schistocerca americana]|uniref:putative lysozyme-like protein n=1 Tax=Schistocerca americana TaxID=7009 RepID=UPI001F4F59E7|nr:putative lysozyme-like protein [Schistocerca americana]
MVHERGFQAETKAHTCALQTAARPTGYKAHSCRPGIIRSLDKLSRSNHHPAAMASKSALVLTLLIAVSQAAPQGQVQDAAPQQSNSSTSATGSNSDTSSSGSGGSDSSGAQSGGGSSSSQTPSVVFPHLSNLLPQFNFSGSPSTASAQNPIAAIISFIPNAINTERERVSSAVNQLVSEQVGAATDSISAAAQTGGQLMSNGIKVIASWPTFWANLLG